MTARISPAKVVRLQDVLPRVTCLFMNWREAASLAATGADAEAPDIAARLAAAHRFHFQVEFHHL